MSTQLVVSGSIALDRIMNFTGRYRELIETSKLEILSVSVLVDSLEIATGGNAANIAHNLAILGEKPVLLGSIGSDADSYLQKLATRGVDVSHVNHSNLPTASFNVLTDSEGNQVGGFYPGAMSDAGELSLAPWAGQDVLACVAANDPTFMRRQTDECAEHQIRLLYDPGQQVSSLSGEDLLAGIQAAEVVIVNGYELDMLSRKTGLSETDLQAKVPIFIATHGERGSVISGHSLPQPITIGIARPATVSDPTGAGDAYRAGFLYGYLRQWEIAKCGQLGAVMASFALEQHGPQAEISAAQVAQRYQQTFNQELVF